MPQPVIPSAVIKCEHFICLRLFEVIDKMMGSRVFREPESRESGLTLLSVSFVSQESYSHTIGHPKLRSVLYTVARGAI